MAYGAILGQTTMIPNSTVLLQKNLIKLPTANTGWNDIAYGGNKFIAINNSYPGDGLAAYSNDNGYNWVQMSLPIEYPNKIIYNNNFFVILPKTGNTIAYSNDGIDWETQTISGASFDENTKICYGLNRFNILTSSSLFYSTDLISWNNISFTSVPGGNVSIAGFAGNKDNIIVLFSNTNTIKYITSSNTWEQSTLPLSKEWSNIIFNNIDNNYYIVAKNYHLMYTSSTPNGTWNSVNISYHSPWNIILPTYQGVLVIGEDSRWVLVKGAINSSGTSEFLNNCVSGAYSQNNCAILNSDNNYITLSNAIGINNINWSSSKPIITDLIGDDISDYFSTGLGSTAIIETGSYIGTGKYGSTNSNSITFNNPVEYAIIVCYKQIGSSFIYPLVQDSDPKIMAPFIPCFILTNNYTNSGGPTQDTSNNSFTKISSDRRTVSWYSTSSSGDQYNYENYEYFYIGFCKKGG